ncbi:MAG: ABC exporter membrane fusion protein [Phormidesmis sp.]
MNLSGALSSQGVSDADRATGTRRRWLILISALLVLSAGFTGWRLWQARLERIQTAELEATRLPVIPTVTALGRLEPQGELINLSAPSAEQGSRVEELLVQAGDRVQPGQTIAVLDSRDRRQAALQKAEENVQIARAQLAQVKAGAKSGDIQAQSAEIARLAAAEETEATAQRATIARLEAEVQNARTDYERYRLLYERGAISASERDTRQLTYTTAQRQLEEATAQLNRILSTSQQQIAQARATLDSIQEVRPVDVTTAQAQVASAIAEVAEAKANLDQAVVRSPSAGQIIKIHTRPGESIADSGIATLGQTEQMMVVAEVYQSDIGKVQLGQAVMVTTPVISEMLQGTVERIGLQVEQQRVVNEDPAANIDAKVVEVYIRLDAESSEKVIGLTNLQVNATIQTE